MWYFVKGLRPLGWLGFFVGLLGSEVVTAFAQQRNWGFVALGAVLMCAGAIVMLRNRRADED
jgi:hypothetical protein